VIGADGKHRRYSLATSADVLAIFDDEAPTPSTAVVEVFDRDHADDAEQRLEQLNGDANPKPAKAEQPAPAPRRQRSRTSK
jgi:hypothetical protein